MAKHGMYEKNRQLLDAPPFQIKHLAILPEDIPAFNLPRLRIKTTDSRAGEFLREYGTQGVELDALPPAELRRRIAQAVRNRIDRAAWKWAALAEKAQKDTNERIAEKLARLQRVAP